MTTRPVPYEAIPNGWYVAATSDEVRRGAIVEKRLFGRDVVVWRTESGRAAVHEAYCPHLGAHLGGGRVVAESIRCPFHAFEFGTSGACTKTGYGTRPPQRAKLGAIPILEHDGMIFAYHDADGAEPSWEPPRLGADGFTPFRFVAQTLRGHPQEISENSSDLGHFGPVHSYGKAELVGEARVEGHVLAATYRVTRNLDFAGMPHRSAALEFAAEVHGLGYSLVNAKIDAIGLDVLLLVLPTPIDAETVCLRIGLRMKEIPIPGITPLLHRFLLRVYLGEIAQDVPIWAKKRYVEHPALAEGDGPIALYRRYARQFYPASRISMPVLRDESDAAE